jgi:chromosome segregation ATPase
VLLLRDGQGGESVTDIKALIERLRESIKWFKQELEDKAWDHADMYDYFRNATEAADALEELQAELDESRKAYEQVRIQSNEYQRLLCDERRKREEAEKELATLKPRAQPNPDYEWKAKFDAAREVAIESQAAELCPCCPNTIEEDVDAAIAALFETKTNDLP